MKTKTESSTADAIKFLRANQLKKILDAKDPLSHLSYLKELPMEESQNGYDCGFIAAGIERSDVIAYLKANIRNLAIRKLLIPEMRQLVILEQTSLSSLTEEKVADSPSSSTFEKMLTTLKIDPASEKPSSSKQTLDYLFRRLSSAHTERFYIMPSEADDRSEIIEILEERDRAIQSKDQTLTEQAERNLDEYLLRRDVCSRYIKNYYEKSRGWVSFQPQASGGVNSSIIDIFARLKNSKIVIWQEDSQGQIVKIYETAPPLGEASSLTSTSSSSSASASASVACLESSPADSKTHEEAETHILYNGYNHFTRLIKPSEADITAAIISESEKPYDEFSELEILHDVPEVSSVRLTQPSRLIDKIKLMLKETSSRKDLELPKFSIKTFQHDEDSMHSFIKDFFGSKHKKLARELINNFEQNSQLRFLARSCVCLELICRAWNDAEMNRTIKIEKNLSRLMKLSLATITSFESEAEEAPTSHRARAQAELTSQRLNLVLAKLAYLNFKKNGQKISGSEIVKLAVRDDPLTQAPYEADILLQLEKIGIFKIKGSDDLSQASFEFADNLISDYYTSKFIELELTSQNQDKSRRAAVFLARIKYEKGAANILKFLISSLLSESQIEIDTARASAEADLTPCKTQALSLFWDAILDRLDLARGHDSVDYDYLFDQNNKLLSISLVNILSELDAKTLKKIPSDCTSIIDQTVTRGLDTNPDYWCEMLMKKPYISQEIISKLASRFLSSTDSKNFTLYGELLIKLVDNGREFYTPKIQEFIDHLNFAPQSQSIHQAAVGIAVAATTFSFAPREIQPHALVTSREIQPQTQQQSQDPIVVEKKITTLRVLTRIIDLDANNFGDVSNLFSLITASSSTDKLKEHIANFLTRLIRKNPTGFLIPFEHLRSWLTSPTQPENKFMQNVADELASTMPEAFESFIEGLVSFYQQPETSSHFAIKKVENFLIKLCLSNPSLLNAHLNKILFILANLTASQEMSISSFASESIARVVVQSGLAEELLKSGDLNDLTLMLLTKAFEFTHTNLVIRRTVNRSEVNYVIILDGKEIGLRGNQQEKEFFIKKFKQVISEEKSPVKPGYYLRRMALLELLGNTDRLYDTAETLLECYRSCGELVEAIDLATKTLGLMKTRPHSSGWNKTLAIIQKLAEIYFIKEDFTLSLETYQKGFVLSETNGHRPLNLLETIGKIYQKIGGVENLQKATETYLRVHSLATETRNSSMQESARKNLEEIRATISSTYGSEHGLEHNPDAARIFSLAEAPMPSLAAPAGFSFGRTVSATSAVPLAKQFSIKHR